MKFYKYSKKSLIAYLVASVVVLFIASFGSGYVIGSKLGYEAGKSENDVVLSSVVRNFMQNKDELEKLFDSKDAKYAAFGEVVENNSDSLLLMNIFGIERKVIKTSEVKYFQDIQEGDRVFVVGEPAQNGSLEARFYKKLPLPSLRLFEGGKEL
ncbi:MAG: hypothetical protein UR28_C0008G0036 [Candidatus Peregrinibacteria bacterium GW2011_GWF2_33_10]|nr:MAG: hypothetical protein UR28_C0008G0036 [Candidatus Peregrinibacteria bacterium GW2011_GWF2_33_10]OGJ44939.1 MAG: hypothetical protein A2272_02750 [Candidatus Peregrinibacteria bacterium RIFOXYA12_FULL_33_12]OGJ45237.1 MAG: hypothetical protein A2263_06725 [Candidatus Peregrinibacteria bacterium RIFOXYA2_FULL_33_21]OGJ51161.1 MAG: hypothetical protein A2307_04810 [Candidatus Peregrinibacteria bacterium RIFOXYB2_FULL_33_20]